MTWKVVAIAPLTGYAAYELERQHGHSSSLFAQSFNSAVHQIVQGVGGVSKYSGTSTMQRKKKGGVDETLSDEPLNDPNLEDISHSKAREKGHYQLRDKETGQIVHHDKGKPGATGHEGHDHYHRPNPNSSGNHDKYLDAKGNAVPKGSEPSHLYPPEWIWWN